MKQARDILVIVAFFLAVTYISAVVAREVMFGG